jgi:hypothetical protein
VWLKPRRVAGHCVVGGMLLLVGVFGCGSQEDASFRSSVGGVLNHAAGLDREINDSYGLGEGAPDSVARAFQREVASLPQARNKKLRYLAVRLAALGDAAAEGVLAQSLMRHASIVYAEAVEHANYSAESKAERDSALGRIGQDAGKTMRLFAEDYEVVAVAEEVGLGTSLLWDRLSSSLMTAPSDSDLASTMRTGMDSVRAEREKFVRQDLRRFR